MIRIIDQLLIGIWGAIVTVSAIMDRSWEVLFSGVAYGAFFFIGNWAARSLRAKHVLVRRAAVVLFCCFILVILGALLEMAERLYLVNSSTYPAWLGKSSSSSVIALNKEGSLIDIKGEDCEKKLIEIWRKAHGQIVIRCGGLMWHDSHTYVIQSKVKEEQQFVIRCGGLMWHDSHTYFIQSKVKEEQQ